MIKFTIEHNGMQVKTWIDSDTGSLCIEGNDTIIEVPYMVGIELVSMLRQKQEQYQESKKKNWFDKFWR